MHASVPRATRCRQSRCRRSWPDGCAARGVWLSAGGRGPSFVGHRFVSRCGADTGRPCWSTVRVAGGSAATEQAISGVDARVKASSRLRVASAMANAIPCVVEVAGWRVAALCELGGRPRIGGVRMSHATSDIGPRASRVVRRAWYVCALVACVSVLVSRPGRAHEGTRAARYDKIGCEMWRRANHGCEPVRARCPRGVKGERSRGATMDFL